MTITTNSLNANSSTPLNATDGGTGISAPTAHGVMISEGASAVNPIVLSAGQLLIGTTSGDPSAATLTQGTGITITNASGAVTIATSGSAGFSSLAQQTFTSSGTYTPTSGMAWIIVEMQGAGGGAAFTNAGCIYNSGGGAGGYVRAIYSAATVGASQTVTIGAGGTGGGSASTGGTGGGSSTFIDLTGGGGSGGAYAASAGVPSVNQTAGGSINYTGGTHILVDSTGASASNLGTIITSTLIAPPGANAFYSGGGVLSAYCGSTSGDANGNTGSAFGQGGSTGVSAVSSSTGVSGGNGTGGFVRILEFIG